MNPPLRPEAPQPTVAPSSSTTSLRRVALLGEDRGPQAGVAAADDAQVAGLGPHQRLVGVGLVDVVEPVRVGLGVGQGWRCGSEAMGVSGNATPPAY